MSFKIENKINRYNVISFDIFDTLIKRNVDNPTDVFDLVEREYNKRNLKRISNFKIKRISAERNARINKTTEEITLDKIYNELSNVFKKDILDRLKKLEIEIEEKICIVNPRIEKIYKKCIEQNKIVIITTDMYLPRYVIENILNRNGIYNYYKLYISCELNKTKHTGSIYDFILNDLKINKKQIIHIGDNQRSDFIVPMLKQIKAINIKNNFLKKNKIKGLSLDYNVMQNFIENTINLDKDYYWKFGYKNFGPLLYGFSKWIFNEITKKNIRKIFFLSRDGYIMKKVFEKIFDNNEYDIKYLYASRRALAVPTLWMLDTVEEMLNTSYIPDIISLRAIFKKIGLDINNYINEIKKYNFNIESCINMKEDNAKLFSLLNNLKNDIYANSKDEYDTLLEYWKQENFSGKLAIVDIGWFGNMQKAINRIVEKSKIDIDIFGYYVGIVPDSMIDAKKGYIFDRNKNEELYRREKNFNAIFEMIFLAPHGSVKKFKKINNLIDAELYDYEYNNSNEEKYVRKIQEGALEFIEQFSNNSASQLTDISELDAFYNMMNFGNNPSLEDSIKFGELLFYDNDIRYIAKPKNIFQYIINPIKFKKEFYNSQWKIGFLKRLLKVSLNYELICDKIRTKYERMKEKKYGKNN